MEYTRQRGRDGAMNLQLREMKTSDASEVAELICASHNTWSRLHALAPPFGGGPESTELFFNVYGALEGSSGVVAENIRTRVLTGLSFYHIRPTHVSLGMMSVHPNYFGLGVARELVSYITDIADRENKPIRLISSALNIGSFSLYSKAGFVPRQIYQDILISVPENGFPPNARNAAAIRDAVPDDVEDMVQLEFEISGIRRGSDYTYLLANRDGFWHVSVSAGGSWGIDGFLVSCGHSDMSMLGPGVATTQDGTLALITAELNRYRGRTLLLLVPADCDKLVRHLYEMGGRNNELHLCQVRGAYRHFQGVSLPTFILESG
jgi:GNAT superfamily N-acetyltransferase